MAAGRFGYNKSQLFNFAPDSYLERTSRPIYALIFLLPFIVFYEMGTILSNTDVMNQIQDRVVAFIWLQSLLDRYLGFGSKLAWAAPPLAVVVILLALQLASRKPWYFGLADFGPMIIECVLLAMPLIVLSLFLSGLAKPTGEVIQSSHHMTEDRLLTSDPSTALRASFCLLSSVFNSNDAASKSLLADIVTGIGAGIYEELIFRLILMCILMVVLEDLMGLSHKGSITLAVLVSAALFSAHHHVFFVNGHFESSLPFSWREFSFRTVAGTYFAVLFAIRGFGITVGTHAFYDIMAALINAAFFQH